MKYQDILYILKENLRILLNRKDLQDSPSKFFSYQNLNRGAYSPDTKDSKRGNGNNLYRNNRENSEISDDFSEYSNRYSRFYEESSRISNNSEKIMQKNYKKTPSLSVHAKIDEIKALVAAKEREDQIRAVEYQKKLDQMQAERDRALTLSLQINEKRQKNQILKREDRNYGLELDERKKFMEKLYSEEQERQKFSRKAYSEALSSQIIEKSIEKNYLNQLDFESKKIFTPDVFYDRLSPYENSSFSKERSVLQTPLKSPLKFLAQYGNFVVTKGKNN